MMTVSTFGEYYNAISRGIPEIRINLRFNENELMKFKSVTSAGEIRTMNAYTVFMATGRVKFGGISDFITNVSLKLKYKQVLKNYFPSISKYEGNYAVKEVDYSHDKHCGFMILVHK